MPPYGHVVEGDPQHLVGRMGDELGVVRSENGDMIGRAEIVSQGDREGLKEEPFGPTMGLHGRQERQPAGVDGGGHH